MEPSIFRFIFRHSKRQQLLLLALTGASFPFLYYSFELPKLIINQAIGGRDFPRELFGMSLDQVPYLMVLCFIFLALVLINGGFKYTINVFKGQLGERMLRRLRFELFSRVLRYPLDHFRRTSAGEIIPMVTSEVEPLGGFIGDSFSLPAFQGGTLLTIVAFMFVQDPILGAAAISLYPIQAWVIPRLQKRVNMLAKERVRTVRKLSDRIGETVAGVSEIHAHDTAQLELTDFSTRLGRIYDIRYDIYRKKFFIKFLNNFLAQLTPFFFYSIGGYLVIRGDLTFGALVAVLAAYKDMSAPWKELLAYYQQKEDARIKYEQVIDQFHPEGMLDPALQTDEPDMPAPLTGTLEAANLGLIQDESVRLLEGVTFSLPLDAHVAVVGTGNSGKDSLGLLLARLAMPTSGRLLLAGHDLTKLPESVTGRRLAYVGPNAHLFSASVRDNLLYGLKHRPLREPDYDGAAADARARAVHEAELTANVAFDPAADWVDYAAAGAEGAALTARMFQVLHDFGMDEDIYDMGLRGSIDPDRRPDLADSALAARAALRKRLAEPELAPLVEPFDEDKYNGNASVAENLLFGTPVGPEFDIDGLAENAYVREVLEETDLLSDLIAMGGKVAETMVELFSDLPPGHEFFEQFSFIAHDDLPDYQALLARTRKQAPDAMRADDRARLLGLPFKLVPARHRLGLIDEAFQARLLDARRVFREKLPEESQDAVAFYDPDRYNAAASLQDNILFGKIAYGQAESAARVGAAIAEVVETLDMRAKVMEVGLDFEVGIGGGRLSAALRQKLAIARCILKRPDVLIVNEATASFDSATQARFLGALRAEFDGRGLIWITHLAEIARGFDRVLVLKAGRLVESGTPEELSRPDSELNALSGAA